MRYILLLALILPSIGCNGVNRLLGQESKGSMPAQQNIDPNNYYITGTTSKDYQSVYLTIKNRTITVEIIRPGETQWVMLERIDPPYNPYQLFTIPSQGVHFGDRAEKDSKGTLHVYTGTPVASIGTQYRIHSVAI